MIRRLRRVEQVMSMRFSEATPARGLATLNLVEWRGYGAVDAAKSRLRASTVRLFEKSTKVLEERQLGLPHGEEPIAAAWSPNCRNLAVRLRSPSPL
eukprot:1602308-Pyramimonas_sp.AAC.1